jgi:ribosomal protein S18 acetylase RimI-like enzyme
MLKITHHKKTLKRYPGVLIGRLAVNNDVEFKHKGIGSEMIDIVKQWYRSDEIKAGCRMLIVDALNEPDVLSFYRKNGFETLFTTEQQEDFYVNPPKDEEQRLMRLANPAKLETRLMFTDLLKE